MDYANKADVEDTELEDDLIFKLVVLGTFFVGFQAKPWEVETMKANASYNIKRIHLETTVHKNQSPESPLN